MRLLHALSFSLLACSCNVSLSDIVTFEIPYNVPEQSVPGNAAANAAGIAIALPPTTFPVNVDVAAQAKANGVSGVISHVTLKSLTFNITSTDLTAGDTDCFDFVQSVSLSVSSTKSGTTLPSAVIATGANPGCVQSFSLATDATVNLKPYIDEGASITMTGQAIPPADDVSFDGVIDLHASI